MSRCFVSTFVLAALLSGIATAHAQTREDKVRNDRKNVQAAGFWIYNDLARGFAEAKKSGKPMIVVFRCIPCTECVKLDDDLVNEDKRVRPLLEKFVRVRVVSTNGLDLSLFQFDTDQSFAGFFLNGDGTIYGRYGTRSHRTYWSDDVSVVGLSKALEGALELHKQYPANKAILASNRGPAPEFSSPEKYPLLRGKFTSKLDYKGQVVKSCIHCHQVGDAMRDHLIKETGSLPEQILFPYPHPKALGLILDPRERATVLRVTENSLADKAGFKAGDRIVSLAGRPLLSIADVQWNLHHTPADGATLKAVVNRKGNEQSLALVLPKGWRRLDDFSWRVSTWPMRRMVTGGMRLVTIPKNERDKLGIGAATMALRVDHVGQYGPHAAAKRAGFRKDDIILAYDGNSSLQREADLIVHGIQNHKAGDRVRVLLKRGSKQLTLTLPIQD